MATIEINYQTKVPHKYEALFQKLGRQAAKILKVKDEIDLSSAFFNRILSTKRVLDLSVTFVSPKKIMELNKSYRGKDKVTDVLSFDDINEIIICYSQAVRQAKEQRHSVKKEVSILFVHGLLHLLGFDDRTKKGAQKMRQVTEEILH